MFVWKDGDATEELRGENIELRAPSVRIED
jgi:hypothetical protein